MPIDTVTLNNSMALPDLIGRYSQLRKVSTGEWAGPCPKCGGTDRLHVKHDGWFCRQCYPFGNGNPHDAIEFMRWMHNCSFTEAATMLDPTVTIHATPVRPQPQARHEPESTWVQHDAEAHVLDCQRKLKGSNGEAYLAGRGFAHETWFAFGIGYDAKRDAIAMPWYHRSVLTGIRYRLLNPTGKQKIVSEVGSRFSGYLYGAHALDVPLTGWTADDYDPRPRRSFVLVEGELNAMSIWQATREMRVDVLSIGSESQALPASLVGITAMHRARIVWADKREVAEKHAKALDAGAAWSETDKGKTDANDLLRTDKLTQYIGGMLWAATPAEGKTALGYDLFDSGLTQYVQETK